MSNEDDDDRRQNLSARGNGKLTKWIRDQLV